MGDGRPDPRSLEDERADVGLHRARHRHRVQDLPDGAGAELRRRAGRRPPDAIRNDPRVIKAYLGDEIDHA
ncbi:hypothetical protein [Methylobacterium tarhaniae]|uniref:ABC transporter ATP-binding protein C-terminal domain-containing protein n=1 Tax=Methylobacterium tarhaniae TaxID=1187852 RepID=UPI003CC9C0BB